MDDAPPPPVYVYCPRCDRRYSGATKKEAEKVAEKHFDGQHQDQDNPFKKGYV